MASVEPSANFVDATQRLVLTLGSARGVDEMITLPGFVSPNSSTPSELAVLPVRIPDGIPTRPEGFDAAEVIVVDTNNQALMDALAGGKGPALVDWVRNGGHLVVAVAANWQQVGDSVLGPLLPARPSGTFELRDPAVLESFIASKKGPTPPIAVARLVPVEARSPKILLSTASSPLIVRGAYGFGRVTLIGLNVDQKPFADWADKKLFWAKALELRGHMAETAGAPNQVPGTFYRAEDADLANVLHMSLEKFPGVRLVPFGWVAFFVFLYILLIGPGDYLFLKKVVKRMELTWITFPTIVIAVSLLAYVAAYAVKGTELKINKVDVLDVDQTTGLARGTTWLTLFSPQNRDYNVRVVPIPVGSKPPQQVPKSLPPKVDLALSWFNAPESRRPAAATAASASATRAIRYEPMGEALALEGVRVPIWSTKGFSARWSAPATKVVDSDLKPFGSDRLSGTVTNRLDVPLQNAVIVFGKQVYDKVGTIAPGASVSLDGAANRTLGGWLGDESNSFNGVNTNQYPYQTVDDSQLAGINRSSLVRVLMFREALGSRSSKTSVPLQYLDLSGLTALGRPMLVAEVKAPAAMLSLGKLPSPPQVDQTTVVRVLLPIASAEEEETAPKAKAEAKPKTP